MTAKAGASGGAPKTTDAVLTQSITREVAKRVVGQEVMVERLLIGLRYFDGHSMAEIAALSARPVGTVTKQLSRAVARLRAWWDKETLR